MAVKRLAEPFDNRFSRVTRNCRAQKNRRNGIYFNRVMISIAKAHLFALERHALISAKLEGSKKETALTRASSVPAKGEARNLKGLSRN